MTQTNRLFLYGGAYATADDARADLDGIGELHHQKRIGRYDAVAIGKDAEGKVRQIDTDATVRGEGAWKGALAGAVLGVIFPPSILLVASAGAVAGAVAGDFNKRIGLEDARQLADLLGPGESGVLFLTEWVDDAFQSAVLKHATRQKAVVIDADSDVIAEALKAAENG
jgi:uncharacterized membrane protein